MSKGNDNICLIILNTVPNIWEISVVNMEKKWKMNVALYLVHNIAEMSDAILLPLDGD